jgi:hypothetical protein
MAPKNITVTVPNSSTYYQDPNQLCLPSSWADTIIFFFGNYLAHVATVRSEIADTGLITFVNRALCLFFPPYGMLKAVQMMTSCATFAGSTIQKATRAGALVMVVRAKDNWQPESKDIILNAILRGPKQSETPTQGTN